MKKILVTGAAGFIGSHLVELLVKNGYEITAFVRYNSKNSWGWLDSSAIKNHISVIAGDIRDYDSVHAALKGCDTVFHLAALIGIPYSYQSPKAYIETNINGTYNVLQASRELDIENIIITSTSETYGSAQFIPMSEEHPANAQSPYAATKVAADQLAITFYRSFNLPVKLVRPFNTYGPRQSARAIIPAIIIQLLGGKQVLELGNMQPTRDFTYVADTANGFLEIAQASELIGQATNIGMNKEISIKDLVAKITDLLDVDIKINSSQERLRPERSEVDRLLCDNSKILKYTNWRPSYDLSSGLTQTIEFLRANSHYYKSEQYNV